MNEQILELADKAVEDIPSGPWNPWNIPDEFCKKFAELIVTDAIGVLQKRFMGDLNREDMEVRRCIEDLKKHFGVEE